MAGTVHSHFQPEKYTVHMHESQSQDRHSAKWSTNWETFMLAFLEIENFTILWFIQRGHHHAVRNLQTTQILPSTTDIFSYTPRFLNVF